MEKPRVSAWRRESGREDFCKNRLPDGEAVDWTERLKKSPRTITVRGDMERLTRLELATSTLARWRSTR